MRRILRNGILVVTIAATALSLASCGGQTEEGRPIEILYFVKGPSGTKFEIVGAGDNLDCTAESTEQASGRIRSRGFGFQSSDASHVLDGTFRAPHFFILENETQPTRAVFRNLGDASLTVLRLLGAAGGSTLLTNHTIAPGECISISNFPDADETAGSGSPPFDLAEDFRIEVCSFAKATVLPDDFRCQDLPPRGTTDTDADGGVLLDIGASFLATVGDLTTSFLTRCLQVDADQRTECQTPATFYMNNPQDQVSVAVTRLNNQVDSFLQVDLYRGDKLLDSDRGTGDVTAREDL